MRNFIWFWRRSVPRCKSSMEHSHEQFKQRISFGLLPAAQSVCGCLKVATRPAAAPSSGWSELLAHYGPLPFPLSTAPLKWPRWTENGEVRCGASWVGAESSVYLPHYHLFASNDKKALTASAPAAPPLWFSAHFSPDSILDFFNLHSYFPIKTLAKGKSLHTSNVESGKKCALINFVGSSSSEELKGERLWFRVTNLLLGHLLPSCNLQQILDWLRTIGSRPPPRSIRLCGDLWFPCRIAIIFGLCEEMSKLVGCFTKVVLRQNLLRSFNKALMLDVD